MGFPCFFAAPQTFSQRWPFFTCSTIRAVASQTIKSKRKVEIKLTDKPAKNKRVEKAVRFSKRIKSWMQVPKSTPHTLKGYFLRIKNRKKYLMRSKSNLGLTKEITLCSKTTLNLCLEKVSDLIFSTNNIFHTSTKKALLIMEYFNSIYPAVWIQVKIKISSS